MKKTILVFRILLLCSLQAFAEIKLPYIVSDNMVLQREESVRIWGWAEPGDVVTVEFAGQRKSGTADPQGEWRVTLDPMPASAENRAMQIHTAGESERIQNVLVGEVWLASGQSNMGWSVMGESSWPEAQQFPSNDQIRLFKQERTPSGIPAGDTPKTSWTPDDPGSRRHFSAVAYYFGRELQQALGVPVGISMAAEGGTKCQYWTPLEAFESKPDYQDYLELAQYARDHFDEIKQSFETELTEWQRKRTAGEKVGRPPVHYGRYPSFYYNGNIHPIRNYTIRGAIWYQGERNSINTRDAYEYRAYFPLMIESWRKAFQHPEMPFYFVQLPKMGLRDTRDVPVMRDSQFWTAQHLKNANMVVTFDQGEASLHPKTKRFIGERLANMARAEVYGQKVDTLFPLYIRSEAQEASIRVQFEHTGEGLRSSDGKPLRAFTICGPDQKFVEASAVIQGNAVVVSSPAIPSPVAVRYAWSNAPDVNLTGSNGLPASPFRTDDFKLPEKNPRQKNYTHFQ